MPKKIAYPAHLIEKFKSYVSDAEEQGEDSSDWTEKVRKVLDFWALLDTHATFIE
jgi:hypothetical protein